VGSLPNCTICGSLFRACTFLSAPAGKAGIPRQGHVRMLRASNTMTVWRKVAASCHSRESGNPLAPRPSWTPACPARPSAATKTTLAERNEKKRKKGVAGKPRDTAGGGWATRRSPLSCVFFRFFRLHSLRSFRPFLPEEQDAAPLQCGGDKRSRRLTLVEALIDIAPAGR
jgi:hypothetical protein